MDIAHSSHNLNRPTRGLGYFANLQELVYEARRELFAGYIPSVDGALVVPSVVPPDEKSVTQTNNNNLCILYGDRFISFCTFVGKDVLLLTYKFQ